MNITPEQWTIIAKKHPRAYNDIQIFNLQNEFVASLNEYASLSRLRSKGQLYSTYEKRYDWLRARLLQISDFPACREAAEKNFYSHWHIYDRFEHALCDSHSASPGQKYSQIWKPGIHETTCSRCTSIIEVLGPDYLRGPWLK